MPCPFFEVLPPFTFQVSRLFSDPSFFFFFPESLLQINLIHLITICHYVTLHTPFVFLFFCSVSDVVDSRVVTFGAVAVIPFSLFVF